MSAKAKAKKSAQRPSMKGLLPNIRRMLAAKRSDAQIHRALDKKFTAPYVRYYTAYARKGA